MLTLQAFLAQSRRDVWSVGPDQTVWEALELMAARNIGAVPVLEDGVLTGIFSERDYARRVELKGLQTRQTHVRDVMTQQLISVHPGQKIDECMQIMTEHRVRHLPVIDQGKLVGLVSIGDVVSVMIKEQRTLIEQLQHYISS